MVISNIILIAQEMEIAKYAKTDLKKKRELNKKHIFIQLL